MGRSAAGRASPALAGAPRGSGHGDHDLASVWAAGAGGIPWLRAPLPTSLEVPVSPQPGGASPGRAQPCRAVPQFPQSQLRLCPLAPWCWQLAQRGTALPGGVCCVGKGARAARGARGAHPRPRRGVGLPPWGNRGTRQLLRVVGNLVGAHRDSGSPLPLWSREPLGVFGVLWACERGTWGRIVHGTPLPGTGWPHMAL